MVPQIGRYIMPQNLFSIIVGIYNNTSDMHTFTAIRGILKLRVAKQNKKCSMVKVGESRHFEEKVGKVGLVLKK